MSARAPDRTDERAEASHSAIELSRGYLVLLVLILAMSALVYLPAVRGGIVWDDKWLIDGSAIGGGDSLIHCFTRPFLLNYYRPLVSATVYLERLVWHTWTPGYHLVNILFHVAATSLVILLTHAAFGRKGLALAAGALFAVQPVQSGAVAWIGGITDSLCVLWSALFGWLLILAARSQSRQRLRLSIGALLAYMLAIFTKEQAVALLAVVPLAFFCFRPSVCGRTITIVDPTGDGATEPAIPRTRTRTVLFASIPFVLVVLAYIVIGTSIRVPHPAPMEHGLGGVAADVFRTVLYYSMLMLAPTPSAMHTYTFENLEHAGSVTTVAGAAVLIAGLTCFIILIRTERALAWLFAFSAISMIPVSNILPLPALPLSPYRAAIAGIAFAPLLAWLIFECVENPATRSRISGPAVSPIVRTVPWIALIGIIAWHSSVTAIDAGNWVNETRLFGTFVRTDPGNGQARYNLACALMREGKEQEGIDQVAEVLNRAYGSDAWKSPERAVDAYRTDASVASRLKRELGVVETAPALLSMLFGEIAYSYNRMGNRALAERSFRAAYGIKPDDYNMAVALAWSMWSNGNPDEAAEILRGAISDRPSLPEAHLLLGRIEVAKGNWPAALVELRNRAWAQPISVDALVALGEAERRAGDPRKSEAAFIEALKRTPKARQ